MICKFLEEQNDMDLENNFISNSNQAAHDIEEELKIENILHNNANNNNLDNTLNVKQINQIINLSKNDEKKIKMENSIIQQLTKGQKKSYHTKAINRNKNSQSRFTKRHTFGINKFDIEEQDNNPNDVDLNKICHKAKKNSGSKRNGYKTYNDLVSTLQHLSKFDWLENNSINSKFLPGLLLLKWFNNFE